MIDLSWRLFVVEPRPVVGKKRRQTSVSDELLRLQNETLTAVLELVDVERDRLAVDRERWKGKC